MDEYNPLEICPDDVSITIDYTNEANFKAGMQELRHQMAWIRSQINEAEMCHKRLSDIYNDGVKRYIASSTEPCFSTTYIPLHIADTR